MSDNTFWIIFLCIIVAYLSISAYSDYRIALLDKEAAIDISRQKEETTRLYQKSLAEITKLVKEN